jgi:PAS domain S-box-containing protein
LVKILNVNDDGATRCGRTEVLRRAGYTIVEAANADEALDRCRVEQPDLVLLDGVVPHLNIDVCREMKADASSSRPLVLLVSAAKTGIEDQISSLEAGADGYLREPVQPELLVATIRSLLRLRGNWAQVDNDANGGRFAQLLAGLGLWEWDPETNQITASDGSFRQHASEGQSGVMTLEAMLDLIHSHDRESVRKALLHAVARREPYNGEFRVVLPDGSVRWLYSQARTLCDPTGETVRVVGTTLDVTDCKASEKGLRENEWKLARLMESNIVGMVETDLVQITEANAAFLQITGYTREDLDSGKLLWLEITPPEYVGLIRDLRQLQKDAAGESFQMELLRRDGSRVPVLFAASLLSSKPEWLCFVLDQSEAKHAEDELTDMRSKLSHSNEYLAHFAFTASHDLREPLRTITEQVQLLMRDYSGKLDDTANASVGDIMAAATRMNNLLQELLAFSQVHSTRDIPMRPTSLENVLQLVLFDLKWLIQESGASLTHDPLPVVNGNLEQLARVFQNLIVNSIKYRRSDEPPRIHISAKQQNDEWVISVSDNGMGFERKYANRIYDAFTRLHGRHISGSGLGLAIVKKIVEDHGGRVWAESEPGSGATFYLTLCDIQLCVASFESAAG